MLEVYGMTETSSVHTIAYPDRPIRLGSAGLPVPYSRVRIVKLDADGRFERDCAPDEIGVVSMAGPGVFGGYLNDAHNRGAFVEAGWVNSGDLGRLDSDGYLWITGRAKDLVIRGGHNIDPAPIEDIMFQHPAVGLAAVVGQPDAYAGELPVGYVQLKPGASVQPGELEAWVRERTPERAAVPVQVIPIDPMPLTGVGKVFKPKLRWDAAGRVFATALTPLRERGIDCRVKVGAHGSHGSIATVTIAGVPNEIARGRRQRGAHDPRAVRDAARSDPRLGHDPDAIEERLAPLFQSSGQRRAACCIRDRAVAASAMPASISPRPSPISRSSRSLRVRSRTRLACRSRWAMMAATAPLMSWPAREMKYPNVLRIVAEAGVWPVV